jgi:hypothetical protein
MVLIVDPLASYNEPDTPQLARYRIVSAVKLKDMRLAITVGNPSKQVCSRTGMVVPVNEQGGITVVRTVRKDARNYKRNIALSHAREKMKKGGASPIYINDRAIVTKFDVACTHSWSRRG